MLNEYSMTSIEADIEKLAPEITQLGVQAESLGQLPQECVLLLKRLGIAKMMMPKSFGGLECHPNAFFSILMKLAAINPSVGWVAGVVGIHPWETALNDIRLQNEIWKETPDAWIASPYSPMGVAVPREGGYELTGHWTFSSGTDFCDWIVLGACEGDCDGNVIEPVKVLHVMLPRADYQVQEGSWNAVGLLGTGSKDVKVDHKFVPTHRVIDAEVVMTPELAPRVHNESALYRLPWSAVFPNAITAVVLGICDGALREARAYIRHKVTAGKGCAPDPIIMSTLGEASSAISIAKQILFYHVGKMYEDAEKNIVTGKIQRAAARRDQVTGAWRAVRAINDVFTKCGAQAISTKAPLHRFWRDANAGLNHITFSTNKIYQASALLEMDIDNDEVINQALV